jgi:hypothetical protein
VQWAVAPVDADYASTMLRSLRGAGIFDGVRGGPPVDVGSVAEVIVAVGELMAQEPEISELDLNPVLASAAGCLAVDWRIRVSPQRGAQPRESAQ